MRRLRLKTLATSCGVKTQVGEAVRNDVIYPTILQLNLSTKTQNRKLKSKVAEQLERSLKAQGVKLERISGAQPASRA